MVELQPSKLNTRVRFPSPAPLNLLRVTMSFFFLTLKQDRIINMNYELVVASTNRHKVQEIRNILSPHKITVYGLKDLNIDERDVIEDGKCYQDNAFIKANAYSNDINKPIIADDSGIEIDALGGKPGLLSARFAEEMGGHDKAIEYIISKVKETGINTARFVCCIVLVNEENKPLVFEAKVEGKINLEAKGKAGFGYDPIFIPDGLDKTYAELSEQEKNKLSHRARALGKLLLYLKINDKCI